MDTMRLSIPLLVLAVGAPAFADTLLSVSAAAGAQNCYQASAASASCTVSSSVYVPAGEFYSPVTAGGSISFAPSASPGTLGPQTLSSLDYTLQGTWYMAQGLGLSGQAAVTLNATIDLPADSGNWVFYGSSYDATDDSGGQLGPIQIITSDGTGSISGSFSSFTIDHTPGTPLSLSLSLPDFVGEADSSNDLNFDIRMTDPIATPEPASWLLMLPALGFGWLVKKPR
jgi:hypothetical protein